LTRAVAIWRGCSSKADKEMPAMILSRFFLPAFVLLATTYARADDDVIDRWYAALLAVDRAAISDLLSDDARIKLDDLGVEQSKAEFIASMEEWETAAAGATIRHRVEKVEGGVTTVIACYDFPANDILMRETFAVTGDKITASSQAAIAETCDTY
jgi:hypothetical protein